MIAISLSTFVAIWAASALVDGINKLPLLGDLFELVGLVVTSWFAYRYLIFGPDRCGGGAGGDTVMTVRTTCIQHSNHRSLVHL